MRPSAFPPPSSVPLDRGDDDSCPRTDCVHWNRLLPAPGYLLRATRRNHWVAGASWPQAHPRSYVPQGLRPPSRRILFVELANATQWLRVVYQQYSTVVQLIPWPRPAQRQLRSYRGRTGKNPVWSRLVRLHCDAHAEQQAANVVIPSSERGAAAKRLAP